MKKEIVSILLIIGILIVVGCSKEMDEEVLTEIPMAEGVEEVSNYLYKLPNTQVEGNYTGYMKDGMPVETGSFEYLDTYNTVYVGTWDNGLPNGLGTYTWKDGDRYVGEVENGRLNGFGKYIYESGIEHEGRFLNGSLVPDKTYGVGEEGAVGEFFATVQNVIKAKVDNETMMQVQIIVENKFVEEINTAHFLKFEIFDGEEKIGYSDISTTYDLYEPFLLDQRIEFTAIFKNIKEDGNYTLLYDFDTIGTGVAVFQLDE